MRILTRIVVAAAAMMVAGSTRAQQISVPVDRATDAAAIRAHIESIFQAFIDKDRPKLEATHGKNWRGFTSGSRRVIRGLDDYMNSGTFPPGMPRGQGMVGYRMSDFDVVFYGDTAVASFVADVDSVYGDDKITYKLTLVDVYHKDPSGWIQVASSTNPHPDTVEQQMSQVWRLSDEDRAAILAAREAVWRAWFAGDTEALSRLVPPELITLGPGNDPFATRDSNLTQSREFVRAGGKLTRLTFPRTEFQAYGRTVTLYTSYETDVASGGETHKERGVATEVFVLQNGRWINTGWQVAPSSRQ